VRLYFYKK